MKKEIIFLFGILLISLIASVSALSVEEIAKSPVIVLELNNPAVFEFKINSEQDSDSIEIYSPIGILMSPKGTFNIEKGENKVEVKVYPNNDMRKYEGYFSFVYEIKSQKEGLYRGRMQVEIVKISDALLIKPVELTPGDALTNVEIVNLKNSYFDNIGISIKSKFFDYKSNFSLSPFGSVKISVPIDVKNSSNLAAGKYIINAELNSGQYSGRIDGIFNYIEKKEINITEKKSGFIVKRNEITKANTGNTEIIGVIEKNIDILSRLFMSSSVEPSETVRRGFFTSYKWEKNLLPGESFSVITTTNYTLPFIIVILLAIIIFAVRIYVRTALVINKSVSFVKTKGGEFALRVRLSLRSRANLDSIQLIDRLPGTTKLYEQSGTKPDRIEESSRKLIWNIGKMSPGEERIISYIIYSKLKIVGRFELPPASAVFEREGIKDIVFSNKAFFMNETITVD